MRAPSGRQRFNVLGALNAITHQLLVITNETYITSTEVCALLSKIADAHVGQGVSVILDNARYQRCAKVQEYAQALGIELVFVPPYSPNLNLIERLWRFVKDTCLYSKYYPSFADFKHAIQECLNETNGKYAKQLATLLTLKFQTFENVKL